MVEPLFAEPARAVRSRRLVYRVVLLHGGFGYPPGWPLVHRFTRAAANVQVHKLAEQGIRAVVQRGRIEWEVEQ